MLRCDLFTMNLLAWWREELYCEDERKGILLQKKGAFKVLFTTCFSLLSTRSYYLYKASKGEFGCSLTRYLPLDLTACLCSNRRLHIQWNSFWYVSLMKKSSEEKNIHLPNTISAAGSFVPSPLSQWSREKISSSAFWAF